MVHDEALTIPRWLNERVEGRSLTPDVILVVSASLVIALSAQIAVPLPISPVPMTLQPLAILLIGAALGSRRGAAAAILYLLEGASGFPFFSQGRGGLLHLAGPTAGYLFAFPLGAWIAGRFSELGWMRSFTRTASGMAIALGVILAGGWAWLALTIGARNAFAAGIAPFLIGDAVKIAIAATLLPFVSRLIRK